MTITLAPSSSFILELMLTHAGADEAALVRALEQAGLRHVAVLEHENALVGQARAHGHLPPRNVTHIRARTLKIPVQLQNTEKNQWMGVWPILLDIHEGASVLQSPAVFTPGGTYDVRFLTPRASRANIHVLLRRLNFRVLEGPFVLRRHVYYPRLRGELVDAVARVTWLGKKIEWKVGTAMGPILFEDIKQLSADMNR